MFYKDLADEAHIFVGPSPHRFREPKPERKENQPKSFKRAYDPHGAQGLL